MSETLDHIRAMPAHRRRQYRLETMDMLGGAGRNYHRLLDEFHLQRVRVRALIQEAHAAGAKPWDLAEASGLPVGTVNRMLEESYGLA